MLKQMHLAAHFPGSHNITVWDDPRSGSYIAFDSFLRLARTAERAKFDYFFLAEGLRLRELGGRIHDLDPVGRPDNFAVLAALAAVTDRLGLGATINATFNEPFEVARQFATLDHLSSGRAAWNVVTTSNAFTGANFRRGGFLPHPQRYERAEEFVRAAWQMWDGGTADFTYRGKHFDIHGRFSVPTPPQGRPVIIQAGASEQGREFAAATADVIFSPHDEFLPGQRFYADVKRRLARYGRSKSDLKIMPAATFVLGDTDAEARERARLVRRRQVSPQTAMLLAGQVWGRDLSGYDADGPLPDIEPAPIDAGSPNGRAKAYPDPVKTVRQWRELAAARNLSLRDLIIEVTGWHAFVGSPQTVAAEMNRYVQAEACDGFILWPAVLPDGLDEFVDRVVPLLVERGVFRAEYTGTTLREHLCLPDLRRDVG